MLPRCLNSVLEACHILPISTTVDVVVACDSSTDLTFHIARQILADHGTVVTTDAGTVGHASALATQVALRRYSGQLRRCWLANTDADCCVPGSWLVDQVLLADQGIETIAGVVDIDSFDEHGAGVDRRFRNSYILHRMAPILMFTERIWAYGPMYPPAMNEKVSRRYQELDLYLRQSHVERDLEALGRAMKIASDE